MTTEQIFLGLGLIVLLAVCSQLLAAALRIPALIVLLPVGFTAGALTGDVDPNKLLGSAFSPLVSLAVALILYDAGLGLELRELRGHTRRIVIRLIWLGVLITWAFAGLFGGLFLELSTRVAVMLGVILVVSGPTVVGPLLDFVRPVDRVQSVLIWEGSLIDPIGGILGALVFHAVDTDSQRDLPVQLVQFLASAGLGLAGGVVGAGVLWLASRTLRLGEVLGTTVQLAVVVAVAAGCDALRDDSGLIAAIAMGLAVANIPGFALPPRRPFFETLVSLTLGLLFISISATITPESLRHVALPTLGLVAVLVLVTRPLVAAVTTWRTDLARGERGMIGWMAPRGIVAAATAATFSTTLVARGIGGAQKILPATFMVIVATVVLYGLTAVPVARMLHVVRPAHSRPLLVGGEPWVIDLGRALSSLGMEVLMWAGQDQQREQITQAGLELARGKLLAAATARRAELSGITMMLLLTADDDFNTLCSVVLDRAIDGPIYRLGPAGPEHGAVAPHTGGEVLFDQELTGVAIDRRYQAGARIQLRTADGAVPDRHDLLFVVRPDGRIDPVTRKAAVTADPGDTVVLLGPVPQ
ncbi:cation:proton antiporter [Catenulispora subtropica]|uniref:Cation/H+ exchanger transmembrane domain-containing protein n=1 Tax=Catenulispora subtropica TaxID=450798 RepID=A0ABP5EMC2_9ACTN